MLLVDQRDDRGNHTRELSNLKSMDTTNVYQAFDSRYKHEVEI